MSLTSVKSALSVYIRLSSNMVELLRFSEAMKHEREGSFVEREGGRGDGCWKGRDVCAAGTKQTSRRSSLLLMELAGTKVRGLRGKEKKKEIFIM